MHGTSYMVALMIDPLGYILIWLLLLQPGGCKRRMDISRWELWFWADKAMNNSVLFTVLFKNRCYKFL